MKKLFLLALLSFTLTFTYANSSTGVLHKKLKTIEPGDIYFRLFLDGCYHLGIEVEDEYGDIWWEPMGLSYGNMDWYCCTLTICMAQDEFDRLC
ncbi:MAG: hypothetical protein JST29_03750 [Bacteroidetes bacterium]|nr:hypothetical protein [Bacteroidota bacterium]MBS1591380.1 hypothetical protein [Bacteroidota bacterium]